MLAAVAGDLHLAVFDWAITHGLRRLPEGSPLYGTEDPAKLFAQIAELQVNGLFVLKDAAAHLTAPAVARSFRELLTRFASPGTLSTVVLVGAAVALPDELDALAIRYDLALPSAAEYRVAIAAVAEALAAGTPAVVSKGAPWAGLENHGAGWWVDIGVDPLVACLEDALFRPPEHLVQMGLRGRNWMEADYSWPQVGRQMANTYRWILHGGNKPEWVIDY